MPRQKIIDFLNGSIDIVSFRQRKNLKAKKAIPLGRKVPNGQWIRREGPRRISVKGKAKVICGASDSVMKARVKL